MLVINRTPNTLTNLTVELSTMGDLRLVERPQSHTIGPLDSRNISANIKASEPFAFVLNCIALYHIDLYCNVFYCIVLCCTSIIL